MPPKPANKGNDKDKDKNKKDGKKKEKKKVTPPSTIMRNFLTNYDRKCVHAGTSIPVALRRKIRDCIEEEEYLKCWVFHPNLKPKVGELPINLNTFCETIRAERYLYIEDLHIMNMVLPYTQMAALALLFEKLVYPIKFLEMTNCLISAGSIGRLARTWENNELLQKVTLDYNEFGDVGCEKLRDGMLGNKTVTYLSLNYCGLGPDSGGHLADLVSESAITELYLNGNSLECEGAIDLIGKLADYATQQQYMIAEQKRLVKETEEAAIALANEKMKRRQELGIFSAPEPEPMPVDPFAKKPKRKKKKKEKGPPPVGPFLSKLYLADNGIDIYDEKGLTAPMLCMRVFRELIAGSASLVMLDIDDNLIGDVGAQEILAALKERQAVQPKLPKLYIRMTHKIDPFVLDDIWKLGSGGKKKKKQKAKK